MATTKKKIAEQILRLLKGNSTASSRIQEADIKLLVEQVANQTLKADYFQVNLPEGDTIPNNAMVYTYDNVAVSTYKTTLSKATLPSIPISLPRNMGVLHVSKTTEINNPFVPIPTSTYGIVSPQDLLGSLSNLIGYEVVGKDIIFTQNLPGLGVSSVYIRLVGVDLSALSDYDLLPLSADQEAAVVSGVYKMLITVPQADRVADSNN
jgi:hypothetical protein